MNFKRVIAILAVVCMACVACDTGDSSQKLNQGSLSFHLEAGYDDVVGFFFQVFDPAGEPVADRYVDLEEANFPSRLLPGTGPGHRFSDAYFVMEPGTYVVVVTPMQSEEEASDDCLPVEQTVEVLENETTEVILVSRCDMEDNGGLDVVVITNHDPVIVDLVFNPSKFVLTCDELEVTVTAVDPDEDPMVYTWSIVSAPEGALYDFNPQADVLHFVSRTDGDYEVVVEVCDTVEDAALCATLTFPIHVIMSSDENENGVGDECDTVEVVWTDNPDFEQGQGENVAYEDGAIVINEFQVISTPYLWVPSSNNDKVVLFSTETLEVMNGSPFNCCNNPSRLARDSQGNVYITCRADGRVMKMSLEGEVLWDTSLVSQCGLGLRGAVHVARVGENDRLYVGCSNVGRVFQLDAITGAVDETIETARVYGLAFDGERIYVASRYDGAVQGIDLNSNQLIWSSAIRPYGIAARDGIVWVSRYEEGQACKIDGASGATIHCLPYLNGGRGRGVAISPIDGFVYQALSNINQVAKINPDTYEIVQYAVSGSDNLGVDLDAQNRLYVVSNGSGHITRMNTDGTNHEIFGQGHLVGPYAYSSDLTGANTQYLEANGSWTSNVIDLTTGSWGTSAEGSIVLDISYLGSIPADTDLLVEYMVDQDGTWLPAPSGTGLAGRFDSIQFRASLRSLSVDVSPAMFELLLSFQPW